MDTIRQHRRRQRRGLLTRRRPGCTRGRPRRRHGRHRPRRTLFSDDFYDGNSPAGRPRAEAGRSPPTAAGLRQSGTSSDARSWPARRAGRTTPSRRPSGRRLQRLQPVRRAARPGAEQHQLLLPGACAATTRSSCKRLSGGSATMLDTAALTVGTGTTYTLRLDVIGSSLKGYVNGTLLAEATDTVRQRPDRRRHLQRHATSTTCGCRGRPPTTAPTPTNPTPTPTDATRATPATVADGWASVDAWGQNGTTGGAGGRPSRSTTPPVHHRGGLDRTEDHPGQRH